MNKTMMLGGACLMLAGPAMAQDMAKPTGRSDTTTSGAMKSDSAKSGDMKPNSNSTSSGSSSEQGSSTPAGPAASTEKKM